MATKSIFIILAVTVLTPCIAQQTPVKPVSFQSAQVRTTSSLELITIIALALIPALLYDRYQTRQRTHKRLQSMQQEIDNKNTALENLVKDRDTLQGEKEWLIKEIHHRVKNNLQMVISLLNLQSEFLNNRTAINAIKESRERMEAIAIIHKKLYEMDNNTTAVNMRSYISELVDAIKDCFDDSERINFKIDVDDIYLDISQSVPLGLILNEAITNSVKHAYPGGKKGAITISLGKIAEDQLQLKITDNGKGLQEEIDINHSKTLGFILIKLFSEQLDGDLFFLNENGLQIILNFNINGYNDAINNRITT